MRSHRLSRHQQLLVFAAVTICVSLTLATKASAEESSSCLDGSLPGISQEMPAEAPDHIGQEVGDTLAPVDTQGLAAGGQQGQAASDAQGPKMGEAQDQTTGAAQTDPAGDTQVQNADAQDQPTVDASIDADEAIGEEAAVATGDARGVEEQEDAIASSDVSAAKSADTSATPNDSPIASEGTGDDADSSGAKVTLSADAAKTTSAVEAQAAKDVADEPVVQDREVFSISASANKATRVAVAGNSRASGANVLLASAKTLLGEYWRAFKRDDGAWRLVNLAGSKSLTVSGTPTAGANVLVKSGMGTGWVFERNEDGTVCIIPLGYESLRLALAVDKASVGTNLLLAKAKNGSASQRFNVSSARVLTQAFAEDTRLDKDIVVITSETDKGKAITIAQGSKLDGGNAQLATNKNAITQKFILIHQGCGLYMVQNARSGEYLECANGRSAAGTNVCQRAGDPTLARLWYFVEQANGTFSIRSAKSGLALGVRKASNYEGANVEIQKDSGEAWQRFRVKDTVLYPDGHVFRLSPASASSVLVAVASNSSSAGANVRLQNPEYLLGNWWRVVRDASSSGLSFKLASMRSANYLGVSGKLAHGANVNISRAGTQWIARINDGGTVSLSPSGNRGLVLDAASGGRSAGANVRIARSTDAASQKFVLSYNSALTNAACRGVSMPEAVYNVASSLNTRLVADVARGSLSSGANVRIHSANGTDAQKWALEYVGSGLYRMRDAKSALLLGVAGRGRKNGSNVAQFKADDTLFQLWYLTKSGKGYVVHNAASGFALDVDGSKGKNDANLEINKTNGAKSQTMLFREKPLLANGTYAFNSDLTEYGMLVFEVRGGSTKSGGNVQVYQSNGTDAQKWVLRYQGAGEYTIANKKSGLLLTVAGNSNANGGNIVQASNNGSSYQKWILTVTNSGGIGFKNAGSKKMLEIAGGVSDNRVNVHQNYSRSVKYQSWRVKKNHEKLPAGKLGKFIGRMVYYTDIISVGYDQATPDRWNIRNGGECDCSSLVINCLREAGFKTGDVAENIGKINAGRNKAGCHYTGNMSHYLTRYGWKRIGFSLSKLKPGDILLNDVYHTCAVISGRGTDAYVAQASIDERNQGWYGRSGDQSGYETNIKKAYIYRHGGWNCILRYSN